MQTHPNDPVNAVPGEMMIEGALTKREMFASSALQGLLANTLLNHEETEEEGYEWLACKAVGMADLLISSLNAIPSSGPRK